LANPFASAIEIKLLLLAALDKSPLLR
jgi:hypothetical protein